MQANSFHGWFAFAMDVALYAVGIAAVLWFDALAGKIAGGVLAGLGLTNLGTLSHEAAHRALVKSKAGNKFIAVAAMTMILFNYRLWIHDHHVLHHGRTNVKENNFLSPLTLEEFQAMSRFRQAIYRVYHSETGLGILLYYMLERWPTVHFVPGSWLPKRLHASAWRYALLEALYAAAVLTLLVSVSSAQGHSVVATLLTGFVLPYAIWYMMFSMTAFLQHTNPRLRWYRTTGSVASPPHSLSVQVVLPGWMNHLSHYVMEHPVHHVTAAIPFYHLKKAQTALIGTVGPQTISMPFTIGNMADALRRCKLYDYDRHVWTNFEGEVTGIPDETLLARQAGQVDDALPPYGGEGETAGVFFPDAKGRKAADHVAARENA